MIVLWDFYDTIAAITGSKGGWSSCLLELMHEHGYKYCTIDIVRLHLIDCFPWNRPTLSHKDFFQEKQWWEKMNLQFEKIFIQMGATHYDASLMASMVERRYTDADKWMIYPDVVDTLNQVNSMGHQNYIASNFFPDLHPLVERLNLAHLFKKIYTSGKIGYEKPHSEFYRYILTDLRVSPSDVIMIGDNYQADILGALDAGIKGILVHADNIRGHGFYSKELAGVLKFL